MRPRQLLAKARSWAGARAATPTATDARDVQALSRIQPVDPTLHHLLECLRGQPDEAERRWADRIEAQRRHLEASEETVIFEVDDIAYWEKAIARSKSPTPPVILDDRRVQRNLGELTKGTSKPGDWGRLFHRVVRRLQPGGNLELGTSVGMSGAYLASALKENGRGRLVTLEGQQCSVDVARRVFAELDLDDYVAVQFGQFADTLPAALAALGEVELAFVDGHHQYEPTIRYFEAIAAACRPGGLLIFDDIDYWDQGMAKAWSEIQEHPRVTGSVTLGSIGFAVVDGVPDAHHKLSRKVLQT